MIQYKDPLHQALAATGLVSPEMVRFLCSNPCFAQDNGTPLFDVVENMNTADCAASLISRSRYKIASDAAAKRGESETRRFRHLQNPSATTASASRSADPMIVNPAFFGGAYSEPGGVFSGGNDVFGPGGDFNGGNDVFGPGGNGSLLVGPNFDSSGRGVMPRHDPIHPEFQSREEREHTNNDFPPPRFEDNLQLLQQRKK